MKKLVLKEKLTREEFNELCIDCICELEGEVFDNDTIEQLRNPLDVICPNYGRFWNLWICWGIRTW